MVTGAVALAEFAHVVAEKYPVNVALHTDHCPKDKLDGYVRPLIALSQDRVNAGQEPLFQSHMWDGSAIDLDENLQIAEELLEKAAAAKIVLEVEIGVVGGEEDGVAARHQREALHRRGRLRGHRQKLGLGERGVYLLAATFGNVHGVYKPGNVKLRPEILKQGQDVVAKEFGTVRRQAVQPGLPRRLGLGAVGDPRGAVLRRREDERRHRHPVRVHPADRRPHVHQLRRRPEDRRRGRQQEGLRPAQLPQGRRDRAWPPASSRPARTCCRPASRRPADRCALPRQPAGRAAGHPAAGDTRRRTPSWRRATRRPRSPRTTRRSARPGRRWPRRPCTGPSARCSETIEAYAYARTGYHRGLDALRRNGWKGFGPVPWSHEPNRGFLRCVTVLAKAAEAIGEPDEQERCTQLLRDCDPSLAP